MFEYLNKFGNWFKFSNLRPQLWLLWVFNFKLTYYLNYHIYLLWILMISIISKWLVGLNIYFTLISMSIKLIFSIDKFVVNSSVLKLKLSFSDKDFTFWNLNSLHLLYWTFSCYGWTLHARWLNSIYWWLNSKTLLATHLSIS